MRRADLHIHTDASDDATQPIEHVFARAAALGLAAITISDHEGIAQWAAGRRLADRYGITFVPGIEISATWIGDLAHVLGLFPAGAGPSFTPFMTERLWSERKRVQLTVLEALRREGMQVTVEEYEAEARSGRPDTFHMPLYRLLRRRGIIADAKEYILLRRETGIRFSYPEIPEVVAAIQAAGGIAVLAHPGVSGEDFHLFGEGDLSALADAGLDGVEVWHHTHNAAQIDAYAGIAHRLSLLPTGGSDSHRVDASAGHRVGDYTCDWDAVVAYLAGRRDVAGSLQESPRLLE